MYNVIIYLKMMSPGALWVIVNATDDSLKTAPSELRSEASKSG